MTGDQPVPKIEILPDATQCRRRHRLAIKQQPQPSEIQPVRVFTQPPKELLLTLGTRGITDRAAMGVIFFQPEIFGVLSRRQGKRMPSPL